MLLVFFKNNQSSDMMLSTRIGMGQDSGWTVKKQRHVTLWCKRIF